MQYYSLKSDKKYLDVLKNEYQNYLFASLNAHEYFRIKKDSSLITVYNSGSIVISGDNIESLIDDIEKICQIKTFSAIGSDETGTGDIFGPIVVCAVFLEASALNSLKFSKINDSKKLDDKMITEIAEKYLPYINYSLLVLDNKKYNEVSKKYNMNALKALLHNKAILSLKEKIQDKSDTVPVILDQFCEPKNYFSYLLKENLVYKNIIFKTKAESYHKAVALASIIARYTFVKKMDELSQKYQMKIPKGASNPTKALAKKLKDTLPDEEYLSLIKANFNLD